MPDHSTNHLPMGETSDDTPNIKVIFRGFVITNIRHGMSRDATVGALAGSNCHRPIVHIYSIVNEVSTDITNTLPGFNPNAPGNLSLQVNAPRNIQVFQQDEGDFHPTDDRGNDKKDFRWFANLNKLHAPKKVKLDPSKLNPTFTLNRGIFHTSKLSDSEFVLVRPGSPPTATLYGRFAMEIMARIQINSSQQADFHYEDAQHTPQTFTMAGGTNAPRYEIVFDCTCRSPNETTSDFGDIYQALKQGDPANPNDPPVNIPDEERLKLEPLIVDPPSQVDLGMLATKQADVLGIQIKTPEVYCFGGNCSLC